LKTICDSDRICRDFYQRPTVEVAEDLIGRRLVRISEGKRLSGIIVEVEAYGHADDAASHAYRGRTKRNFVMFGQVGLAYVYFTYGTHFCLNVSARSADSPAGAILIRGIEPVEGVDVMQNQRKYDSIYALASGPGKLTKALGINLGHNGIDLTESKEIFIEYGSKRKTASSVRIGITHAADKRWRFVDPTSPFLSRRVK